MPAKDIYHDTAKNALIKDGWTVTQDPLRLRIGKKDLFVDLGAQRILAAEKGTEKIAVEIKSFVYVRSKRFRRCTGTVRALPERTKYCRT